MLSFSFELDRLLVRNRIHGSISSFIIHQKSGGSTTEITMDDGRVLRFSRSGLLKKEKLPNRAERRKQLNKNV